ncbi:SusC/RagA family TonB-linked outer membrane protein [Hallella colorans]|uniref:SusC/RagA family TonB-linked outer membrane protein n=2 Tax=Hallella colorans TaxID=1703337 RepID=UPI0023F06E21|nr:SusC/RagA family TonB-linked outer membrane protein [Hallella colorans]
MTKLKVLLLMLFCACVLQATYAQNTHGDSDILVDIVVVDATGEGLPGATVKVSGKPIPVLTDMDGKVKLWVRKGEKITVSYLGMQPRVLVVNKPISGTITLSNDEKTLDQVVVTGYQRTTKRRITGSVATIDAKELKDRPLNNLDLLLQGKVAGMDVKALSGRPGETAKVRIRGTNTITGNADPLWVVDGVPLQQNVPTIATNSQIRAGDFSEIFTNGISGINPNDIESVTVLKDASAAAIYGSRAAGGVIVVTTKRGQKGKMHMSYSTNVSLTTTPPRDANLMNASEKLDWEQKLWDQFSASRFNNKQTYPVIGAVGMIRSGYGKYAGLSKQQQDAEIEKLRGHSTDWFKELFRNSVSQSHYLSMSGGGEKSNYYISLGYGNNNGLVKRSSYDRYNISSKLDMQANSRVKLGLSIDLSWQGSHGSSAGVDMFNYAYFANPYERPYNDDGSYAGDQTYHYLRLANGNMDFPMPPNGFNVLRELNNTNSESKNFNVTTIANLSVKILDCLNFEGLASYGYNNNNSDNYNGKDTYAAWTDRPFEPNRQTSKRVYSSISQSSAYNKNYNLRGQFHFFNTFKDNHYVSALLGAEIRGQYAKSIFTKRYGYDPVSGNASIPTFPEGTKIDTGTLLRYASIVNGLSGQSIVEDRFASFYMSMDYSYRNRYVASLTARTDGSNNFGSNEQFNPTGSLGLSWNVDQENFMKPLKPIVSSLSIRTAFGYTGNINKSVYPQLVMDYVNVFRRTDNDYYRMGFLKNAPNDKLRWEKTRDMKLSLDAGFFNERLRLSAEVYKRRTEDAVSEIRVPYTTGFSTQKFNTSTLENNGLELTLYAQFLKTKNWSGSLTANMAYNYNKLVKYTPPTSGLSSGRYEGYPLGSIFSGKLIGVDEMTGIYAYQPRPDAVFNSAADYYNYENYLFYLGTGNAPTNGGYSISLSYKRFSIGVGGSFSIGGKIVNDVTCPVDYSSLEGKTIERIPAQINDLYVNHLNVRRDVVNRWTPENPRTDAYPRIIDAYGEFLGLKNYMTTASTITKASTLEDVSYFKIGSLYLNYSFEESIIRSLRLSSLSVSFTMNNLLTLTNYSGIDPETPGAVYPMARTFTFGLSVGF